MKNLRILTAALLLPLVLTACQTAPTKGDNWSTLADDVGAARLAGPDGVDVVARRRIDGKEYLRRASVRRNALEVAV